MTMPVLTSASSFTASISSCELLTLFNTKSKSNCSALPKQIHHPHPMLSLPAYNILLHGKSMIPASPMWPALSNQHSQHKTRSWYTLTLHLLFSDDRLFKCKCLGIALCSLCPELWITLVCTKKKCSNAPWKTPPPFVVMDFIEYYSHSSSTWGNTFGSSQSQRARQVGEGLHCSLTNPVLSPFPYHSYFPSSLLGFPGITFQTNISSRAFVFKSLDEPYQPKAMLSQWSCILQAWHNRLSPIDCHRLSQTDFLWWPPGSVHSHGNRRNIMIQVYGNSNTVVNTPPTEKKRQQGLLRCLSIITLSLGHPPTPAYVILRVRVLDFRGTRRLPGDGDSRSASVMGYHSSRGASFLVIQFPLSHLFLKITH